MQCNDTRVLRWMRRLSFVPRWTIVPTIRKQSVAEHSFQVAAITLVLLGLHKKGQEGAFRLVVLEKALRHDMSEAATGDEPSPSKEPKDYGSFNQIDITVKMADLIEAILFVEDERMLGNRAMDLIHEGLFSEATRAWRFFDQKHIAPTPFPCVLADLMGATRLSVHPGMEKRP